MNDEIKPEEQAAPTIDQPSAKVRRQRKTKTPTATTKRSESVASRVGRKVAKYTHAERMELLQSIEGMLRSGTHKLRDAIKNVGIGEQTYYNWKKAAEAAGLERPEADADATTNTASDDLQDLVKLEEENRRLRKVLAEKLRAENAELRKKLGLE